MTPLIGKSRIGDSVERGGGGLVEGREGNSRAAADGCGTLFFFRDDQNVLKSTVVVVARAGKDTKNH